MVRESGGSVAHDFAVLDVYRRYRQLKPQGIAELNEGGLQLARALAQEIAGLVDEIRASPHPRPLTLAGSGEKEGQEIG